MEMLDLKAAKKEDYNVIKNVYCNAFPKSERAPFFMIKQKALAGKADMLVARDDGEFVGFMYTVCYADFVYLFYFAVDEKRRGKGYGSRMLRQLQKIYKDKTIFLAREQLDKRADNYEQRVKRREFYLKNGFADLSYRIKEASEIYDVMSIGGTVTAKDYDTLITNWCGKFIRKIVDMRFIENA